MSEETKPNRAAIPPATTPGNSTPNKESQTVNKSPSTWQRIGRLDKHGEGVRLTFKDPFGGEHLLYISRRDVAKIIHDRAPGDVVKIDETPNDIVISTEGRAFRSRTGRALMVRVPYYAGADIAVPWKMFMAVLEGKQQAAPLSIMQSTAPAPAPAMDIRAGLQGCF